MGENSPVDTPKPGKVAGSSGYRKWDTGAEQGLVPAAFRSCVVEGTGDGARHATRRLKQPRAWPLTRWPRRL